MLVMMHALHVSVCNGEALLLSLNRLRSAAHPNTQYTNFHFLSGVCRIGNRLHSYYTPHTCVFCVCVFRYFGWYDRLHADSTIYNATAWVHSAQCIRLHSFIHKYRMEVARDNFRLGECDAMRCTTKMCVRETNSMRPV